MLRSAVKPGLVILGYLAAFTALDVTALAFQIRPGVAVWYPSSGLSFALVLRFGLPYAPVVALASLVSSFLIYRLPQPPLVLFAWATIYAAVYASAATLLRRVFRIDPALPRLRDVTAFVGAALGAALVLALTSVSGSVLAGVMSPGEYAGAVFTWWIGESVGLLSLTLLLLAVVAPALTQIRRQTAIKSFPRIEIAGQVAVTVLVAWLVFGIGLSFHLGLYYLCFLPLAWITLRHRLPGAIMVVTAMDFSAALFARAVGLDLSPLIEVHLFMLAFALTGLFMGAAVNERQQATLALREAEIRYRSLVEQVPVVVYTAELGAKGKWRYVSPRIETVLGFTPEEWLADPEFWRKCLHPDDRDWQLALRATNRAMGEPVHTEYRLITRDGRIVWVQDDAVMSSDAEGSPGLLRGAMVDITARKQAEESAYARAEQLHTLNQLAHDMSGLLEAPALCRVVAQHLRDTFGYFNVGVFTLEPDSEELVLQIVAGAYADLARPGEYRQRVGQGIIGRVARTGVPRGVNDTRHDPDFFELHGMPISSEAAFPLKVGGQLLGVLNVDSDQQNRFGENDVSLLITVSEQLAVALERAHLFREATRHANQIAIINEVSRALAETLDQNQIFDRLAQTVSKLLPDVATLFISLYDSKAKLITAAFGMQDGEPIDVAQLPPIPLQPEGRGTQSEVIHSGEPLIIADLDAALKNALVRVKVGSPGPDTRSALYVPMKAKSKVIGVIQVQSYMPNHFSRVDADLLTLVGNTAAIAIQNARLFADNIQRLDTIGALYSNAQKLSFNRDLQWLAHDVVRTCVQGYGATLAWLGRADPDGSVKLLIHYPEESDYPRRLVARWDESHLGSGLTGRAIRTGFPVVADDIQSDSTLTPWHELAREAGLRSSIALPLIVRDQPIGALSMYSDQADFFNPQRVSFLQAYAHQVAAALDNARLFEETQQRVKQLQALHAIDFAINASVSLPLTLKVVLEQLTAHLRVDAGAILTYNARTQTLEHVASQGFRANNVARTHLRLGEGHAGQAALDRQSKVVADLRLVPDTPARMRLLENENFVFYYAEPLIAKGQIQGVLEVFHRASLDPDVEWLDFLETIAGQAATAIDSAQLFDNLQRTNLELALAYDTTLEGWSRAMDLRDKETEGHTRRVTEMTVRLAQAMGLRDEDILHMRRGALLHD
ncbi:MAG TPA: GAF domain-containing protein, partial [Anaerolineales bacterium]|nr:GAF domain-containing protein [Anaerolineales bacterium]